MGLILRFGYWLARVLEQERGDRVSADWLAEQERRDRRIDHHGRSLSWPINKIVNEHGNFNRWKLGKRGERKAS